MTEQNSTTESVVAVLTPYGAHKIVNAALAEADVRDPKRPQNVKVIPPQMMYNYTTGRVNAGKEPFVKFDLTTGVDREDLVERFIPKYIATLQGKLAKANEPEVEADEATDEAEVEEELVEAE
jgi:hypothetical protein